MMEIANLLLLFVGVFGGFIEKGSSDDLRILILVVSIYGLGLVSLVLSILDDLIV